MKNRIFLLAVGFLLLVPLVAAEPFQKLFSGGSSFINLVGRNVNTTIFFLTFTLILAVLWVGLSQVGKKKQWNRNSMLAIAITVALGTSIPVTLWLTRQGFDLIDLIAKPFIIAIIVGVIGILGSIFYDAQEKKASKTVPYILAISIILFDALLSRPIFYGENWTENLGGVGTIIDMIIAFAWIFFIIVMFRYLFKVFSKHAGLKATAEDVAATSAKAGKSVSSWWQRRKSAKESEQEESREKSKKKKKKVKKDVRLTRRDVRKIHRIVAKVKELLEKLTKLNPAKEHDILEAESMLILLNDKKEEMGGYVGLITKQVEDLEAMEALDPKVAKELKTLKVLESALIGLQDRFTSVLSLLDSSVKRASELVEQMRKETDGRKKIVIGGVLKTLWEKNVDLNITKLKSVIYNIEGEAKDLLSLEQVIQQKEA